MDGWWFRKSRVFSDRSMKIIFSTSATWVRYSELGNSSTFLLLKATLLFLIKAILCGTKRISLLSKSIDLRMWKEDFFLTLRSASSLPYKSYQKVSFFASPTWCIAVFFHLRLSISPFKPIFCAPPSHCTGRHSAKPLLSVQAKEKDCWQKQGLLSFYEICSSLPNKSALFWFSLPSENFPSITNGSSMQFKTKISTQPKEYLLLNQSALSSLDHCNTFNQFWFVCAK